MGDIVLWTLLRLAIAIPLLWVLLGQMNYSLWWLALVLVSYGFIINPAVKAYRKFEEKNKHLFEGTLCSSCKHFEKSAVLCCKYDQHPTDDFIPCEGQDWEPTSFEIEQNAD
jgi:hypothetical protein